MDRVIVIAASAGGLPPLRQIVAALPSRSRASIFIVMHIGPNLSVLPSLLSLTGKLPCRFATDLSLIEKGRIYVAPPDRHMILRDGFISLAHTAKVHHTRPAADPTFMSAATVYGERVIGIVLSGGGMDGAAGLRIIKEHGGTALVQLPRDAASPDMPAAAIRADHPDACLAIEDIAQCVRVLCSLPQSPRLQAHRP